MRSFRRRCVIPLVVCLSWFVLPALGAGRNYEVQDVAVLEVDSIAATEVFKQLGRRERPKKLDPKRARVVILDVTLHSTLPPKENSAASSMVLQEVDLSDFLVRDPAVENLTYTCVGLRLPFEPDDLWTFGWHGNSLSIGESATYQFIFLIPAETKTLEFLQAIPGNEPRSIRRDLVIP